VFAPASLINNAEEFFGNIGADIRHGGNSAHYSGGSDHVQMPAFETFRSPEAYYATLAHELTHYTKHKSRLDRDLGRKRWGDEGYAREELLQNLVQHFFAPIWS
jgi:antirestriction protein ArdC